jgi:hypothetical protein
MFRRIDDLSGEWVALNIFDVLGVLLAILRRLLTPRRWKV